MRFFITRTSDSVAKPCEGAVPVPPEVGVYSWAIEIETLEDLVELSRRLKEHLVLTPSVIEIYDTLREVHI